MQIPILYKLRERLSSEKGFTLLEIIVSLIIVGIITAFVGMGLVYVVEGFLFARMNASTAQKAQIAMARLEKELNNISVSLGTPTSLTFSSYKEGAGGVPVSSLHTILWAGGANPLLLDGDALSDNVNNFGFTYYDTYDDGTGDASWSATSRIIEITLGIKGANGVVSVFTDRVVPRNIW